MENEFAGISPRKVSRYAGIGYLLLIIAGVFAEFFVRGRLIVPGDASATAELILGSEGLFRFGFVSDILMVILDLVVAVLLYVLLRPVDRTLALLAVFLRLGMDAVLAFNMLNHFAALHLLGGGSYLSVFNSEQLQALSLFFLEAHGNGYLISQFFFGPHQLVLGYLVYKSGYIPRIFGIGLALAGVGYLLESLVMFMAPAWESVTYPGLAVAGIAELTFCLWLLLRGVRQQPAANTA
jgi:hypothetical protein